MLSGPGSRDEAAANFDLKIPPEDHPYSNVCVVGSRLFYIVTKVHTEPPGIVIYENTLKALDVTSAKHLWQMPEKTIRDASRLEA